MTDHEKKSEDEIFTRDFFASMGHEIRTPISGIVNMVDLLLNTPLNIEQREYLRTIHNSVQSLLTILNDLLDISKAAAGKLRLERIEFNLISTVEDVVSLFRGKALSQNLNLNLFLSDSLPQIVIGDPHRLRQILSNLVSNAIKFTKEGEVTVRVSAHSSIGNEMRVRFEVRDTGVGISPDKKALLFQPYVQGASDTARHYGGTGLGLMISRRLTELMKGEIGVESPEEGGSIFWFELPLDLPNTLGVTPVSASSSLTGKKIIILDSQTAFRSILKRQIQSWEMQVKECDNVQQIHSEIKSWRKDDEFLFVLIDAQGYGDALKIARDLREVFSDSQLKLVLLSSCGQRDDARQSHEAGYDAYLTKPFDAGQLRGCLQILTENSGKNIITRHTLREKMDQGQKLLVVEDNVVNQMVVLRMLEKMEIRADLAQNGREAVEKFQSGRYDLILMDCQMPEMDGYDAARAIRRFEGDSGGRVPIIAMTAYALTGDREKCLAAGMDDYLTKPIMLESLAESIQSWLAKSKKHQSVLTVSKSEDLVSSESLDLHVLRGLAAYKKPGKPSLIEELVDLYLIETPKKMALIKEGLEKKDAELLEKSAHSLKGSSGILGLKRMMSLSETLQNKGRAGDLENIETFTSELNAEFYKIKPWLERERDSFTK